MILVANKEYKITLTDGTSFKGVYLFDHEEGLARFGPKLLIYPYSQISEAVECAIKVKKSKQKTRKTCKRCGGTGKFLHYGECFGCGGNGVI